MLVIGVIEGESEESRAARVKALTDEFDAGVAKILAGADPIDQQIARGIIARGQAHICPSFDMRLRYMEEAFDWLLGVLRNMRPEKEQAWSKMNNAVADLTGSINRREIAKAKEKENGSASVH